METMTAAAPKRTYITRVHRSLAEKIGNEGADTLTNYLEEVIPAQIEDKIQYLATKEDVAKVRADLKQDIANVRSSVKEDIAKVEVKVAQLETQITQVKSELKEDIARVKTQVAKVELKLSGNIARVKEDVANLRVEIANISASLTKWMIATIITIALGALALYFKK